MIPFEARYQSLLSQLSPEELGQLQQEAAYDDGAVDPTSRYAVPSAPVVNPVGEMTPQPGGQQMAAMNPALQKLLRQQQATKGKPIIPGLKDHRDPNASAHDWHESGGV